jgi:hypothetical protein
LVNALTACVDNRFAARVESLGARSEFAVAWHARWCASNHMRRAASEILVCVVCAEVYGANAFLPI